MSFEKEEAVPDYQELLRFDGRCVVVVGAGGGMGRQAAHAVAQAGAQVLCVDKDGDRADYVAKEIGSAVPWTADATKPDEVSQMFQHAIDRFGNVKAVIDIVGGSIHRSLPDIDASNLQFNMDLNLYSALLIMQSGSPAMAEHGGSMVFTTSAGGLRAAPHHAAYGAAKAALIALVQTAAVELAPQRIRVNAVAPGLTYNQRMAGSIGDQAMKWAKVHVPLGRVAVTSDQAAVMLFLASDLSSYINGQTIIVDGGVRATSPALEVHETLVKRQAEMNSAP